MSREKVGKLRSTWFCCLWFEFERVGEARSSNELFFKEDELFNDEATFSNLFQWAFITISYNKFLNMHSYNKLFKHTELFYEWGEAGGSSLSG